LVLWGLFAVVGIGVFVRIHPDFSTILRSLAMVVVLKPRHGFHLCRTWVKRAGLALVLSSIFTGHLFNLVIG